MPRLSCNKLTASTPRWSNGVRLAGGPAKAGFGESRLSRLACSRVRSGRRFVVEIDDDDAMQVARKSNQIRALCEEQRLNAANACVCQQRERAGRAFRIGMRERVVEDKRHMFAGAERLRRRRAQREIHLLDR